MPHSKTPIAITVLTMLFIAVVVSPVWAQQSAASAISSARNTVVTCYSAAREAEAAGANITVLTATLNTDSSLLSQAEFAYASNDLAAAGSLASQSQNTLNGFIGEANVLKEAATQQQNQDFLFNVVGSIIGAFMVLLVGGVVWVLLKKKYGATESDAS